MHEAAWKWAYFAIVLVIAGASFAMAQAEDFPPIVAETPQKVAGTLADWCLAPSKDNRRSEKEHLRSALVQTFEKLIVRLQKEKNWKIVISTASPPPGAASAVFPDVKGRVVHLALSLQVPGFVSGSRGEITVRVLCGLHELQNALQMDQIVAINAKATSGELDEAGYIQQSIALEFLSIRRASKLLLEKGHLIRPLDEWGIENFVAREMQNAGKPKDEVKRDFMGPFYTQHYRLGFRMLRDLAVGDRNAEISAPARDPEAPNEPSPNLRQDR